MNTGCRFSIGKEIPLKDLAAGSASIIEGEGNSVYKYFLAGGGVNMEIMKSDGSRLSADECVKYLNLFAD